MSLFERNVSRALKNGLKDENGICAGELPSGACWSSKPYGRGHMEVMLRERGTDVTSPTRQTTQQF